MDKNITKDQKPYGEVFNIYSILDVEKQSHTDNENCSLLQTIRRRWWVYKRPVNITFIITRRISQYLKIKELLIFGSNLKIKGVLKQSLFTIMDENNNQTKTNSNYPPIPSLFFCFQYYWYWDIKEQSI
jgi:hypothetical protein